MTELLKYLKTDAVLERIVDLLPDLLAALGIMAAFWLLYRSTRPPLTAVLRRAGFHPTLVSMIVDSIYRFALLGFALIMAADQVGINVGAALAGVGVAGLTIGFAAQDSIANIIAGFLIFWDKPFEVGDWVTVADQYGEVSMITMRTTRIRTNNNTYVVIPNKTIIDEVLVNHTKHGETRVEIPVGIAYKEDIPTARRVILAALESVPDVLREPRPDVVVNALGGSSVDLLVRVWIHEAHSERPVFYAVMEASKLALDAAGIEIPYPHLQLFVEDVRDRVWEKAARFPALTMTADREKPPPV